MEGSIRFKIILLLFVFYISNASGKKWVVDKQSPLNSITRAIRIASSGDTIEIKKGVYAEGNIQNKKPIYIIGYGKAIVV